MEYCDARRPYMEIKTKGEKEYNQITDIKTLFITNWRVHIRNVSRVETYKVLDVPQIGNINSIQVT